MFTGEASGTGPVLARWIINETSQTTNTGPVPFSSSSFDDAGNRTNSGYSTGGEANGTGPVLAR